MTTRTWIGGGSNLAVDPSQWSPTGAPQAGDTLVMTGGTINITDDDLAGDTLTLEAPSSTSVRPFQVGINLVNGSANIGFGTTFTIAAMGAVATGFVGGDGVGFNGGMTIADGSTATFSGAANFVYGFSAKGGAFVNNGAITDSVGTFTTDLSGNGNFTLTRYHDGPGRIEINGAVASTLNFTLSGDRGIYASLILDQPTKFNAPITVLGITPAGQPASDLITLKGITATAYGYDNNTLTLFNGTTVVDTLTLNTATPFEVDQVGNDVSLFFNLTGPGPKLPGYLNPPFPAPYTPGNFAITDVTTGQSFQSAGTPYSGPVAGLDWQLIDVTTDKLDITPTVPNTFIHTGSADDAIDVSKVNGTNVLDGSTGSNFLRGGADNDQFYVDDRAPLADIWSTVAGFHAGDSATIWGVTPQDFTIKTLDNQGAAGFTGLTWQITAAGHPNANLTLADYTTADLSNGKLAISFGHTPDLPNLPGSDYMLIQGVS